MLTPPVLSVFLIRFTTYYKSPILSHMLTRQVLSVFLVRFTTTNHPFFLTCSHDRCSVTLACVCSVGVFACE